MILVDTDVLWELRLPPAGVADTGLHAWAAATAAASLFVSAASLLDLAAGASQLARHDKPAAARVQAWLDGPVAETFADRILPVDAAVARRWAQLRVPPREAVIAATALERNLTLATFDPAAFKPARVRTLDPRRHTPPRSDPRENWRDAAQTGPVWLRSLFTRA